MERGLLQPQTSCCRLSCPPLPDRGVHRERSPADTVCLLGAALVSVPCAADVLQLSAGQKSRVVPRPEGAASRCDVARWWRTGEQSAVTVRQCRELPLCVWPDWGWKKGPLEGHTLETLRPLIPETANSCVTTALALFRAPCAVLR